MLLRVFAVTLAALCAVAPAVAQLPPEAIMPPDIKALHESTGRQIGDDSRCEVLDWIVDPAHGWPTDPSGPVDAARHAADFCVMSHDDLTPAIVARRLGAETFRFDIDGSVMTVLAKTTASEATFCCAPQGKLSRLGDSEYWVARRRISGADRAMISLALMGAAPVQPDQWKRYRGPNAPAEPAEVAIGKWKGQLLQRELKSVALGETRKLSIYLPPGYAKDRKWPALFMTDAGAVEFAGLVEAMIEAHEISPIVIISAESGEQGVIGEAPTRYGDLRSADYLPGWSSGGPRFAQHMTFFSEELVAYAIAEFGVSPERTDRAVAGKSNGGVFALWAGILRPGIFASAVPMSPGWNPPERKDTTQGSRARFFLSAGVYEPPFIRSAQNSEAVLKGAGYDVTGRYYAAGHFHDQWVVALREALLTIFPPR